MSTLILQQEGDWVRLLGPTNRSFVEFLKYNVKPQTTRRYDATTRAWMIYWTQLRIIGNVARRFYSHVDWSTLPDQWQMYLAGGEPPVTSQEATAPLLATPHATLFVTEDAPMEVVRAAYKALVSVNHPDVGGSTKKMAEINQAYEQIRIHHEH